MKKNLYIFSSIVSLFASLPASSMDWDDIQNNSSLPAASMNQNTVPNKNLFKISNTGGRTYTFKIEIFSKITNEEIKNQKGIDIKSRIVPFPEVQQVSGTDRVVYTPRNKESFPLDFTNEKVFSNGYITKTLAGLTNIEIDIDAIPIPGTAFCLKIAGTPYGQEEFSPCNYYFQPYASITQKDLSKGRGLRLLPTERKNTLGTETDLEK